MKSIRSIVGVAAALGFSLMALCAKSEPLVLKFSSGAPARAPMSLYFAEWARKVSKASNGALEVDFVPNGEIGADGQNVERVRSGAAQIGWDLPAYYPGKYPKMDVTTLPLLVDSGEVASVAMWKTYERGLLDEELGDLMPIMFVGFGSVAVVSRAPIHHLNDMMKVKLSAGGRVRSQVVTALGAVPVALKASELYASLQGGSIDGTFTFFSTLPPFKLQEVVSHAIEGPFGGGMGFVVMSRQAFAALPPAVQQVIRAHSGLQASRGAGLALDRLDRFARESFKAMPGKTLRYLSDAELEQVRPQLNAVERAWTKDVPGGKKFIDAYRAEVKAAVAAK